MFSNHDLKAMIVPLFVEQLLLVLVGIVDIFVVSHVSEAAVSGVSLVNSFNMIFILLFVALASGGAVVISQYLGKGDNQAASKTASQLLTISIIFSFLMAAVTICNIRPLLTLLFGAVEPEVMSACVTYLCVSAYSYPALAIYNAGAAMYRSFGNTKTTMRFSIISNVINFVGCLVGVFVLHAGVAGVAWPSLIARVFSAIAITILCFSKNIPICYSPKDIFFWSWGLQKKILRIAVPNGIESGVFQLVKVALSSVVALFGTYEIAANGVAQSIWNIASLVCITMGPVFITVIGQCMGASDIDAARYYFKKLTRISVIFATGWSVFTFILTVLLLRFYPLSEETKSLVIQLVLLHNIFTALTFPFADPLGKGLRATGDVNFTTAVSLFTTIGVRLVLSYIFALHFDLGVMGIAWAMCADWFVRGLIFWWRFQSGRWAKCKVI